ncbi:cuticle protein 38-like [Aricia agestis]|uniref:cuticle protein 38-like n=1 Tax=Aricia agestis TaxID=91739 RepID=UPI001C202481|nr:cuticle protein 38-like [Aricia agestis]
MVSFKSIVLIAAAFTIGVECSGVAAPLVAQAQIGYAHAVPQNIPPYASQVNLYSRAAQFLAAPAVAAPLAAPVAAPVAAPLAAPIAGPVPAPLAAPLPVAGPIAARYAAPFASPYFAGPAPYAANFGYPAPFAPAAYAAPYPYAASAPLVRSPFGVAPAFVR